MEFLEAIFVFCDTKMYLALVAKENWCSLAPRVLATASSDYVSKMMVAVSSNFCGGNCFGGR